MNIRAVFCLGTFHLVLFFFATSIVAMEPDNPFLFLNQVFEARDGDFNGDTSLVRRLLLDDSSPYVREKLAILLTHPKFDPSQLEKFEFGKNIDHELAVDFGIATEKRVHNPIFENKPGSEFQVSEQDGTSKFNELANAVRENDISGAGRLLAENSFLLTMKDENGKTILDRALSLRRIHIVRIFAQKGALYTLESPAELRLLALAALDTPLFEQAAVSIMVANLIEYATHEDNGTFMREGKAPIKDLVFFLAESQAFLPLRNKLSKVLNNSDAVCKKSVSDAVCKKSVPDAVCKKSVSDAVCKKSVPDATCKKSVIEKRDLEKREKALRCGLRGIKKALLKMEGPYSPEKRLLWSIHKVIETRFGVDSYFARAMFIDFLFLRLINPILMADQMDADRVSSAKQLQILANTHLDACEKVLQSAEKSKNFFQRLEKKMREELAIRLEHITAKKFESKELAQAWKEYSAKFVIKARKLLEEIFYASMPKSDDK